MPGLECLGKSRWYPDSELRLRQIILQVVGLGTWLLECVSELMGSCYSEVASCTCDSLVYNTIRVAPIPEIISICRTLIIKIRVVAAQVAAQAVT